LKVVRTPEEKELNSTDKETSYSNLASGQSPDVFYLSDICGTENTTFAMKED
jgi:hypothetical protein